MEKYRAIPQGYMTVGVVAKRMGTTVRTLQYYDKEGLLSPSAESDGGLRLYTDKDIVKLHQIQSMKYLGFSLDDIKTQLVSLETPEEVAAALSRQAEAVREKISVLSESLDAIEKLKAETLQMESVNWRIYADIVMLLQQKNEFYGMIKAMDDKTLDHVRTTFSNEEGMAIVETMRNLFDEAGELQDNGIAPDSGQGQAFGKAWWDMVTAISGGDMTLLNDLTRFATEGGGLGEKYNAQWKAIEPYVEKAVGAYFTHLGINPFEGEEQ